jgi:hypothetical protein
MCDWRARGGPGLRRHCAGRRARAMLAARSDRVWPAGRGGRGASVGPKRALCCTRRPPGPGAPAGRAPRRCIADAGAAGRAGRGERPRGGSARRSTATSAAGRARDAAPGAARRRRWANMQGAGSIRARAVRRSLLLPPVGRLSQSRSHAPRAPNGRSRAPGRASAAVRGDAETPGAAARSPAAAARLAVPRDGAPPAAGGGWAAAVLPRTIMEPTCAAARGDSALWYWRGSGAKNARQVPQASSLLAAASIPAAGRAALFAVRAGATRAAVHRVAPRSRAAGAGASCGATNADWSTVRVKAERKLVAGAAPLPSCRAVNPAPPLPPRPRDGRHPHPPARS